MLNQTPLVRMTSELPPSTREPGRRGKQGETRARLIQVAIELVRTEGLAALTTSRITRAAGIAQPGFYAHFRNVEEVLQTAVMQVIDEMREKVSAMRRRSFERFRQPEGLSSIDATRAVYQDVLEAFLSEPAFAELLLRYHRDTSPLGATMRRVMDRIRADVTEDMWRNVEAAGFGEEHRAFVSLWTDQILALYFAGAEALLDGRYQDKALVLDSLARSSFAIMRANLRALEATRTSTPAPAQPSSTSSAAPVSKSGPAPRGSSETATSVPTLRGVSASRKSAKRA
jgi:TetR/AcrR family transcriptional regulator, fatty acid biosynthesis regulator